MLDVTDTHLLECNEYKVDASGNVAYYLLRAVPKGAGKLETIMLKPSDVISLHKFKVALVNRCIFYTASKAEHARNIMRLCQFPLRAV
ncbi:hypothetical protein ACPPVV_18765 [Rhodanobacter sp. Col0626]|uniref:hypothetical protein n=1 Tax=Rhodanobacter sp. Col0626 TaxID=3415679 RepID=UPI003CF15563